MNKKDNDLFLNLVANPSFSLHDFSLVGVTADNTSLQKPDYYKNNPFVLKAYTKEDGRFDEKRFTNDYNAALSAFVLMSDDNFVKNLEKQFKYAASNITVSPELKDYSKPYRTITVANPTRQSFGMTGWKEEGKRKLSADELAQSNKVLLNPTTAGEDLKNAQWGENPHDGFFKYMGNTLVMAAWDSDGLHTDPITGELMNHKKGEYKIGPDGTYYYEMLDGRDIYDKKVLNKMNVLTEEGSAWNKLDFLDSDDIHKSIGGTIMKNLALVGSMFISYVGPVVTGLSLIPNLVGITGTLGKMATGSSNSLFSEFEGFGKSWALQGNVSEEAQLSTWNLENFINLIGDTMSLLKLQRFLFQYVPAVVKGKFAGSKEATDKLQQGFKEAADKYYTTKLADLNKQYELTNDIQYAIKAQELQLGLKTLASLKSIVDTDSYIKGYNKLGEILSKGYMTAITVHDTYGEAKAAGASDLEASLLTLGYGAAEAWILNTGIGEWILPELHNLRAYNRASVRKLIESLQSKESPNEIISIKKIKEALAGDKSDKRKWALNVINTTRDFFKGEFFANGARSGGIIASTVAGGLGEGVEEVSEEILADVSKGLFNTVQWLQGDDTRMSSFGYSWKDGKREWSGKDVFDRYSMSLLGGIIGGGLTNLGTSFNTYKDLASMTPEQALLHVVYEARNNGLGEIRKILSKEKIANSELASRPTIDADGNVDFTASGNNSQDAEVKRVLNYIFDFVEDTLSASKTNLSDNEFLDKLILEEWRYQSLYNSQTAVSFLNEFNKLNTDLIAETLNLQRELEKLKDLNKDGVTSDTEERTVTPNPDVLKNINESKQRIQDINKKLEGFLKGDHAVEFMSRAFIEMNPYLKENYNLVSFPTFVLYEYGKKYEELSDSLKKLAEESYKKYVKNPETRDNIKYAARQLIEMSKKLSPDLPNMISDIDSEDYNKAVAAFTSLLDINKLNNEDLDFLNAALLSRNRIQSLIRIVDILDHNSLQLIQKQKKDTKENIDETLKKDKQEKEDTKNKTIEDSKVLREEEIKKIDEEINNLEAEIELHRQLLATTSGVEKGKHTRFINLNTPKLDLLKAEKASKVLAIAAKYDDLDNITISNYNDEIKELEETAELDKQIADIIAIDNINLNVVDNLLNYTQAIILKGYIDSGLKNEINRVLDVLEDYTSNLGDDPVNTINPEDQMEFIESIRLQINNLPSNKIEAVLNQFSISTSNTPLLYTDLIKSIYDLLSSNKLISEFLALENIEEAIANAKLNINMLSAVIKSAMVDTISIIRGNPFGFNAMLNQISEKQDKPLNLATITEQEGMKFLIQLGNMKALLEYMERIYSINKGNKFGLNERAMTAITQTRFESLRLFINRGDTDNPLKTWNNYNELKVSILAAIKDCKVSDWTPEEIEKAKSDVLDAFYKFAQLNKDNLKDIDKVTEFMDSFNLTDKSKESLFNDKIQTLDDLSFVLYILSNMAMKSSDFYYTVSNSDFGDVALFPPQVEVARMTLASIMNRNLYRTFTEAIRKSVKKKVDSMTKELFAQTLADNYGIEVNNLFIQTVSVDETKANWFKLLQLPSISNISLVEGIAGSGKTFAVFKIIDTILSNIPLFKDKKCFFAHGANPENAQIKEIGDKIFKDGQIAYFTKEELMLHFVLDYKDIDKTKTPYEVLPGTTRYGSDIVLETTQTLKDNAEIPSVIFIDEITLFSELDALLLELFAEKHNILIIAAGDFHLNCISANIPFNLSNNVKLDFGINLNNRQFLAKAPKLGISIRGENSLITNGLLLLEAHLNSAKDANTLRTGPGVEYHYNGDNLYGFKINHNTQQALDDIKRIVNTLENDKDKITFIYNDSKSELYNIINSDSNLRKYFIFKKDSDAQGSETKYVVVDILNNNYNYNNISDLNIIWKYIYTGMTRAKQGAIINISNSVNLTLGSTVIDSMYSEKGYKEHLAKYSKTKLDFLKKIYNAGNFPEYIEPTIPQNNNLPNNLPNGLNNPPTTPVPPTPPPTNPPSNPPLPPMNSPTNPPIPNGQGGSGTQYANNTSNPITINLQTYPFNIGDTIQVFDTNGALVDEVTIKEAYIRPFSNDNIIKVTNSSGTDVELSLDEFNNNFGTKYKHKPIPPNLIEIELNKIQAEGFTKDLLTTIDDAKNLQTLSELFNSLANANGLQPSILQGYPYIGIDTVEDLIKLFQGDTSLLKRETDINKPHLIYLFGDNISKLEDIKDIVVPTELVNVLTNYFNGNSNIKIYDVNDYGNIIFGKELAASLSFMDDEGWDILETSNDIHDDTDNINDNNDDKSLESDSKYEEIGFYSVNSLELGAVEDGPNSFQYDTLGTDPKTGIGRIDNVNGLKFMIDNGLINNLFIINSLNNRDRQNCLNILGLILKIILNTKNKKDILDLLGNLFGNSDFFINFGIKRVTSWSARKGLNGDVTENTPVHKNENEKCYDLDTTEAESDKTSTLLLVALIGHQSQGEVLEIPLFSLSNPITLIKSVVNNSLLVYPQAAQLILQYERAGRPVVEALLQIVNDSSTPNFLKNYLRIYLSGNYFVYRFGIVKLNPTTGKWENTTLNNWTPAQNLTNLGMTFSLKKGVYLSDQSKLNYDVRENNDKGWNPLPDVISQSNNPRFIYSLNIYQVPNTGVLSFTPDTGVAMTVQMLAGHNFILVSEDSSIVTDKLMFEYYIRLKLPGSNLPPKVREIYVIPPEANLLEYRLFIDNILNKNAGNLNYRIGFRNTVHKILSLLVGNISDPTVLSIANEFGNRILLFVNRETSIDEFKSIIQLADALYEDYVNSGKSKDKLKKYNDFFKSKWPNKSETIYDVLKNIFIEGTTSYNADNTRTVNTDMILKLLTVINIANDQRKSEGKPEIRFYYTTRLSTQNALFGAVPLMGVTNGYLQVGTEKKAFYIHGKLDSYTFRGKLPLLNKIANEYVRLNNESTDNVKLSVGYLRNSNLPTLQGIDLAPILSLIDNVLQGTNVQYLISGNFNTTEEALDNVVKFINSNPANSFIAYRDGDTLKRTNLGNNFIQGGSIYFTDLNDNPIDKFVDGLSFKIYKLHNGQKEFVEATYENGLIFYYDKMESSEVEENLIDPLMTNLRLDPSYQNWVTNNLRVNPGNPDSPMLDEFAEYENLEDKDNILWDYDELINKLNELRALNPNDSILTLVIELTKLAKAIADKENNMCKLKLRL